MKLRSIALAGVALAALTVPAAASDYMGWYLGAGIGYGYPEIVHIDTALGSAGRTHIAYDPDALGVVSFGYKWDANIRTELELGYKGHSTDPDFLREFGANLGGGVTIKSVLFNVNYDIPLWHGLSWTIGAGIGGGGMLQDTKIGSVKLIHGRHVGHLRPALELRRLLRRLALSRLRDRLRLQFGHPRPRPDPHQQADRERRADRRALVPGAAGPAAAASPAAAPAAAASSAPAASDGQDVHRLLRLR